MEGHNQGLCEARSLGRRTTLVRTAWEQFQVWATFSLIPHAHAGVFSLDVYGRRLMVKLADNNGFMVRVDTLSFELRTMAEWNRDKGTIVRWEAVLPCRAALNIVLYSFNSKTNFCPHICLYLPKLASSSQINITMPMYSNRPLTTHSQSSPSALFP